MFGVRYEGLPGRLWASYSCQLMSDTLLTDLSLHIHDSTLGQDIFWCTNVGSLTEKRPRKVGYMLFVAGNSSVTPCVCIVYIVCSLCTSFSLVSAMISFLLYIRWCWWHGTVTASPWRWEKITQHVSVVKMCCWMAPLHRAAAVRDCTVSHLDAVPTTGWTDLYEGSHWHPPFMSLVWRFLHLCILDGQSIQLGIAAVGASQTRHIPVLLLPPGHDPLQITGVQNHPKNSGVQKMGSHPCDFAPKKNQTRSDSLAPPILAPNFCSGVRSLTEL